MKAHAAAPGQEQRAPVAALASPINGRAEVAVQPLLGRAAVLPAASPGQAEAQPLGFAGQREARLPAPGVRAAAPAG